MIPYGRQSISEADIESVLQVLRSDFLTQGPQVPAFERAVAAHVGAPFAIAVNSATSALHIACLSLSVGLGDWVWTSPNSFVASGNCALYCGAKIDFVDIDPCTYNMCPRALETKLIAAAKANCLPKVVIPVHFAGQSCDMKAISELAKRYGFKVIEDASHAIGGKFDGEFVGTCRYSDITVFSFHPVKIITTAEGGMLTTRDLVLNQRLTELRSHGIVREKDRLNILDPGDWYYEQQDLGYNYRMTEMQAALGRSQLIKLDGFVARRHYLKDRYNDSLAKLPIVIPFQSASNFSSLHLYVVQILNTAKADRRRIFDALRSAGIMVNVHYIPIHLQPYYVRMGFNAGDFPVSELYYDRAISLPLYADLTEADQDFVILKLTELLS